MGLEVNIFKVIPFSDHEPSLQPTGLAAQHEKIERNHSQISILDFRAYISQLVWRFIAAQLVMQRSKNICSSTAPSTRIPSHIYRTICFVCSSKNLQLQVTKIKFKFFRDFEGKLRRETLGKRVVSK